MGITGINVTIGHGHHTVITTLPLRGNWQVAQGMVISMFSRPPVGLRPPPSINNFACCAASLN